MIGAVIFLILFYIGLYQLVRFYDNSYKHNWYYKYQDRKRKIKKKLGLAKKDNRARTTDRILGYQDLV